MPDTTRTFVTPGLLRLTGPGWHERTRVWFVVANFKFFPDAGPLRITRLCRAPARLVVLFLMFLSFHQNAAAVVVAVGQTYLGILRLVLVHALRFCRDINMDINDVVISTTFKTAHVPCSPCGFQQTCQITAVLCVAVGCGRLTAFCIGCGAVVLWFFFALRFIRGSPSLVYFFSPLPSARKDNVFVLVVVVTNNQHGRCC